MWHYDFYRMKNDKGERCLFGVIPERNKEQVEIHDESHVIKPKSIIHIHDARNVWEMKLEAGWKPISVNSRTIMEVVTNVETYC